MTYSKLSNITQKWVDILHPFTCEYNVKITASELENITQIPQQTISRVLIEMCELYLIESEISGKNKYYYFNFEKITSKMLLEIIEQKKAIDFSLKKPEIAIIINEILNHCDSIIIFGSYSNYLSNKNSDLDLIIINGNDNEVNKIKKKYTIEINYENLKYSELIKSLKDKKPLALEIKKNHIFFSDVSKLVNIFLKNE